MLKNLFFVLFFLLITQISYAKQEIEVLKVYDGDSILAKIDDNIFRIRLYGIDCFEGAKSDRAKWQAKKYKLSVEEIINGGNIAGEILKEKLKNKKVMFDFKGIDKYSRALGNLYVDNVSIEDEMLKTPYCFIYKK